MVEASTCGNIGHYCGSRGDGPSFPLIQCIVASASERFAKCKCTSSIYNRPKHPNVSSLPQKIPQAELPHLPYTPPMKNILLLTLVSLLPLTSYAQTSTSSVLCLSPNGTILARPTCRVGDVRLNKSNFATALGLGTNTSSGGGTTVKVKTLNLADCKISSATNSSSASNGQNGVAVSCPAGRAVFGFEVSNSGVQESKQAIDDIQTVYDKSGLPVGLQASTRGVENRFNTITVKANCCLVAEAK